MAKAGAKKKLFKSYAVVNADNCTGCEACIEVCPVDCIYQGGRKMYNNPRECIDCGACEPVCPVEAIYYEDDTPEQWAEYYKVNVEFFDEVGSPGGAAKLGNMGIDHPIVAALPAQAQG